MPSLQITWYGHSNVMLSSGGSSVLIDPFFEGNPFAPNWRSIPRPDIVAVTHDHGDHLGQAMKIVRSTGAVLACIADLAGFFREHGIPPSQIINDGMGWNVDGTVRCHDISLTMTKAFHSCTIGSAVGFVIELPGGHAVYHAGDTGLFSDMTLIGRRFKLDLALLPVGGVFTMDGCLASQAAAMLEVPAVMPIHYATFPVLAPNADVFVKEIAHYAPQCRVFIPELCKTVDFI